MSRDNERAAEEHMERLREQELVKFIENVTGYDASRNDTQFSL